MSAALTSCRRLGTTSPSTSFLSLPTVGLAGDLALTFGPHDGDAFDPYNVSDIEHVLFGD